MEKHVSSTKPRPDTTGWKTLKEHLASLDLPAEPPESPLGKTGLAIARRWRKQHGNPIRGRREGCYIYPPEWGERIKQVWDIEYSRYKLFAKTGSYECSQCFSKCDRVIEGMCVSCRAHYRKFPPEQWSLNPSCQVLEYEYLHFLAFYGERDKAIQALAKAYEMDPVRLAQSVKHFPEEIRQEEEFGECA